MRPGVCLLALLLASCDPLDQQFGDGPLTLTDAPSYALVSVGGVLAVDIPFRFENRLPQPVYIQRCGGRLLPILERRVGSEWRTEWDAIPFQTCPTTIGPLVIAENGLYQDTARIYAFPSGGERMPQFRSDDVTGTYRLVWSRAMREFDYESSPPGELLPLRHRISNEFQLDGP